MEVSGPWAALPDIFLSAHGVAFDFEAKRARAVKEGAEHFLTKLDFTARTQVAHWIAQQH